MQIERVVVGVDPTMSTAAARWAARYIAPDADFVLVHSLAPEDARDDTSQKRIAAQAFLRDLRWKMWPARVRTLVRSGDPGRVLLEAVAELGADLVVVGLPRHGDGGIADPSGVACRLAASSPVPVLIAQDAIDGPPRRLLLPVSGSEIDVEEYDWTRALASRFDADIVVVEVQEGSKMPTRVGLGGAAGAARTAKMVPWQRLAQGRRDGRVFSDAMKGDPVGVVMTELERFHSDLVVLRPVADAAVSGISSSATATRVLRAANCSVLVLPGERPA